MYLENLSSNEVLTKSLKKKFPNKVGLIHGALKKEEMLAALSRANYVDVQWHTPEQTGYYQPIVTARIN